MSPEARRPVLPGFLLTRFADESGRVMVERRDRSRRLLLSAEQAAAEAGVYDPGPPELERALDRVEGRAAEVVGAILGGTFPVRGEERKYLALFIALQLLLGRGHRARLERSAEALGGLIASSLEEILEADPDAGAPAGADPPRVALAGAPALARSVSARTWQLVHVPTRLLLTGDTPAALWRRPSALAMRSGLAAAEEVRFPLDPRHALILARHAPSGEVVREIGERHARALNRTVAEAAHEWMYYHPESDPLEAVELARS